MGGTRRWPRGRVRRVRRVPNCVWSACGYTVNAPWRISMQARSCATANTRVTSHTRPRMSLPPPPFSLLSSQGEWGPGERGPRKRVRRDLGTRALLLLYLFSIIIIMIRSSRRLPAHLSPGRKRARPRHCCYTHGIRQVDRAVAPAIPPPFHPSLPSPPPPPLAAPRCRRPYPLCRSDPPPLCLVHLTCRGLLQPLRRALVISVGRRPGCGDWEV